MSLKETLDALYAEADELKTKGDELTADEITRADEVIAEIEKNESAQAEAAKRAERLAAFKSANRAEPSKAGDVHAVEGATFGQRFVKSAAFAQFKSDNPAATGPIQFTAKNLGTFGFIRKADPAPVASTAGGGPLATPTRLPDVTNLTYRRQTTLLDLIATGSASTPYVQYRALTAITNNAAIVAEGATKPLSSLTFTLSSAYAYTYADGFKVTNQELADDGIIAGVLDTTLRENLELTIENILLNGTGSGQPFGILATTGVLAQAFATDIPTTIRKAFTLLQTTSQTVPEAIVLNPTDAETVSLLKDGTGRYLGQGPFGPFPPGMWNTPIVTTPLVPVGTALVGKFSSIQLLDLDPVNVLAFNQNEDDARKNLTYLRAEQRSLLLIREPAKIAVATLHA